MSCFFFCFFVARDDTVEVHIHVVTARRLRGVLLDVFMERAHLHEPRAGVHADRVGRLVERGVTEDRDFVDNRFASCL